jgi:non-ribosomal peptide synthetase component E (peptide arylation enzyme)
MLTKINIFNETVAVWLTKAFGTMWVCYAFMVYGLLPVFALFHPQQDAFLYWSNWVQLWSLPLILVGTNILGREAEERARFDHDKLAKSYEEQQRTYSQVIALLKKQEEMMTGMLKQDKVLEAQDVVLADQTEMLRKELLHSDTNATPLPK